MACGCSDPANDTKIFVVVWSDLAVPTEIDNIVVDVNGPSGTFAVTQSLTVGNEAGKTRLPVVVALVPQDNKGLPFEVEATGNLGSSVVVSQSARLSFLPGQSRVLRLSLAVRAGVCSALGTPPVPSGPALNPSTSFQATCRSTTPRPCSCLRTPAWPRPRHQTVALPTAA